MLEILTDRPELIRFVATAWQDPVRGMSIGPPKHALQAFHLSKPDRHNP